MKQLLPFLFLLCFFLPAGAAAQDSLKSGTYRFYYESGRLKEKGYFKNGKRHGTWKAYDENGVLVGRTKYRDGNMVWRHVISRGKVIEITDDKGNVKRRSDCGC